MQRRTFLSLLAGAVGAAAAAVAGIPVVGHVLAPLKRAGAGGEKPWLPLGPLTSFQRDAPTRVAVPVSVTDGWATTTEQRAAFVVRTGDAEAVVLSATCPHLGCGVKWKAEGGEFACPCHASGFALDGERKHGPARRGLDPLPVRVVGGDVEIQWVDYAANVAERRPIG